MQDISSIGRFYKNEGFYLEGVLLCRISGSYSQGMMGLVIFEAIQTINYCKLVVYDLEGNSIII